MGREMNFEEAPVPRGAIIKAPGSTRPDQPVPHGLPAETRVRWHASLCTLKG